MIGIARTTQPAGHTTRSQDPWTHCSEAEGYRHYAAFLQERRAEMLLDLGRSLESAAALRQAIALYEEWGARGKAETL